MRALKSELLEKIFFKGQAAGIGWWTFFYVAAFFVVNDPVEFRITYHLDYEVTGPASVLFNVAVAQNSKGTDWAWSSAWRIQQRAGEFSKLRSRFISCTITLCRFIIPPHDSCDGRWHSRYSLGAIADLVAAAKRMSAMIIQLRNAVQTTHRCKAEHVKSVPVIEMFWHKAAWDGVVEVFRLSGHPKAKRCYAWSFTEAQETRFVTVLEIPPVESAQTAVRAAIASEVKK